MEDKKILLDNIDKIHTTEMGVDRIKRNLKIDTADVVEYCKNKVLDKIAIYTNRVKIGIARLKISKLLSIHIAIQSLQHILLSNFQFVKLFLYFISHNFIQSLRSNRKIGCSFLLPERRIFI